MTRKAARDQILKHAWVGDAVLTLYVRERILRDDGLHGLSVYLERGTF